MRRSHGLSLLLVALSTLACGGGAARAPRQRVLAPPRLDLRPFGRVGLVLFSVEGARGSLNELATQRFSEYVLAAQPGVEVLELGPADSVLQRVGERVPGAASAQAFGAAHDVPVVFFGHLKVSKVTPSGGLRGINLPFLEATVSVELSVGLFSTKTGGTLWRSSGAASEKVGGVALVSGEPIFSAKDPKVAYGNLVNGLVNDVTYDLRSTWRWQ